MKGAARSGTLLFLLAEADWELAVLCPPLYESILAIHCRVDMSCHDIQAVAYQNAMLSQAGSLRKAHDVPTWLTKLKLLQQKGLAAEEAIKKWNQQATNEAGPPRSEKDMSSQSVELSRRGMCNPAISCKHLYGGVGSFQSC